MNELISVIIPVYNTEMYLRRCVDSVLSQTYQNLEIILVDDGSNDASPAICDEYEQMDNRVRVIHKRNAGVSEARNTALEYCTGDYIAFVDADDYIQSDMYELLLQCIHQQGVDIAVCNWQWETDAGEWTVTKDSIPKEVYGAHSSTEFAALLYGGGYSNCLVCCLWNKLYKERLFQGEEFYGRVSGDEEMNDRILAKNPSIFVIDDILYVYCENKDSIQHQSFGVNRYRVFDTLEKRIGYFESDESIVNNTKLLYCNLYIEYYFSARKVGIQPYCDKKQYRRFWREVRSDRKTRLRFLLFDISPSIYQVVLTWKRRR